ncbi:hypothetical protein CTAYLR_007336 [Chrysophaeum taylorii]|uniref:Uncharacterized protein n=1 Tax=Chrysophaeum taylorii TaxID=2483200 RepID=A0AAD7XMQ7_9STRA|nr:hypothetical protein CTAYLR_007336 [Chrysophaeum taylorii]
MSAGVEANRQPLRAQQQFLKSKFQIGSCRGPLNYSQTETVFHPDDVPREKRGNKAQVHKWKRGGVSAGEKPLWNDSIMMCSAGTRRVRVNSEHDRPNMYRYNYRAEQLPPKNLEFVPKPHKFRVIALSAEKKKRISDLKALDPVLAGRSKCTEEMPVHRGLRNKPAWNGSSCVVAAEFREAGERTTQRAKVNSIKAKSRLRTYTAPHKLPTLKLRSQARDPADDDEDAPSRQCGGGGNRLATRPTKLARSFEHSGVFEFNGLEGQWMWSDTASFARESPGDVVKVKNPNAYNFASPCATA